MRKYDTHYCVRYHDELAETACDMLVLTKETSEEKEEVDCHFCKRSKVFKRERL